MLRSARRLCKTKGRRVVQRGQKLHHWQDEQGQSKELWTERSAEARREQHHLGTLGAAWTLPHSQRFTAAIYTIYIYRTGSDGVGFLSCLP